MGKSQRRKGVRGERAVARALSAAVGLSYRRNLTETRAGNTGDLTLDGSGSPELEMVVQVKVGKAPPIWKAIEEAEAASNQARQMPVAVVKRDRQRALAVIPFEWFCNLLEHDERFHSR